MLLYIIALAKYLNPHYAWYPEMTDSTVYYGGQGTHPAGHHADKPLPQGRSQDL
jgi:hypothetical protein